MVKGYSMMKYPMDSASFPRSLPAMSSSTAMGSVSMPHPPHGVAPAFHFQPKTVYQGGRKGVPAGPENSSNGLPGDIHDFCRLTLVQSFIIDMADGFQFFKGKDCFSFFFESLGFEFIDNRSGQNASGSFGSWHKQGSFCLPAYNSYGHLTITIGTA